MKTSLFCSINGKDIAIPLSEFKEIKSSLKKEGKVFWLEITSNFAKDVFVKSVAFDFFLEGSMVLEHGWLQSSDVFFREAGESTRKHRIFLKRDQNPFSFRKDFGYLEKSIVSEWFTLIKGKENYLIGAVTTKKQFTQVYARKEKNRLRIRVTCQLDGIILSQNKKIVTEKIALLKGDFKKIKKEFNLLIRDNMEIARKPRAVSGVCCAYYWNSKNVNEKICRAELDALKNKDINVDYFQIDDGYAKAGDWLEYKSMFPNGFKPIIEKCKKYGMKAGIWVSPFIAAADSNLFKMHPEWFIKRNNKYLGLEVSPFEFFPGLDFKILDPTNKQVMEYMKTVLMHFKGLGFEMFKIDFLSSLCLAEYKNKTRAEVLRGSMESIREILGENIYLMSAITQLSPLAGIVDSARAGVDTMLPQVPKAPILNEIGNFMLRQNLRTCEERKHFDFWATDPDCIVLGHGLKEKLIDEHINFITKNNACFWIGDKIGKLNEKQVKLLKNIRYANP